MATPLRIEFAGGLYHVTARGNAREDIYADNCKETTICLTGNNRLVFQAKITET